MMLRCECRAEAVSGRVTIIGMRWWGHVLVLLCLAIFPVLGAAMVWAGIGLLTLPGEWWKGLFLIGAATFFLFVSLMLLDCLFTYRLEVDRSGLRIIGNFTRHQLLWQEITRISLRHNPRGIGYHVLIEVDGSHNPRRHWSRLWTLGYQVPTPMDKGPSELAAFLKRKRRAYLKPQQD
jgi:hypothetical protein